MVSIKQVRLIGDDGIPLGSGHLPFVSCDIDETEGKTVLEVVAHRLRSHPHFRGRGHCINAEFAQGCLVLQGRVPSFYLKQLAQAALVGIDGVERLDNQITVQCPYGVGLEVQNGDAIHRKAK